MKKAISFTMASRRKKKKHRFVKLTKELQIILRTIIVIIDKKNIYIKKADQKPIPRGSPGGSVV